jgi:hypothetical protein
MPIRLTASGPGIGAQGQSDWVGIVAKASGWSALMRPAVRKPAGVILVMAELPHWRCRPTHDAEPDAGPTENADAIDLDAR